MKDYDLYSQATQPSNRKGETAMNSKQRGQFRRMMGRVLSGEWITAKRGTRKAALLNLVKRHLDTDHQARQLARRLKVSLVQTTAPEVIETDASRAQRLTALAEKSLENLAQQPPLAPQPKMSQTVINAIKAACGTIWRFFRGNHASAAPVVATTK
jgi:hypothetical protein